MDIHVIILIVKMNEFIFIILLIISIAAIVNSLCIFISLGEDSVLVCGRCWQKIYIYYDCDLRRPPRLYSCLQTALDYISARVTVVSCRSPRIQRS